MPRKKPALESKPITRFAGIETKYSSIDEKPGSLRKADGTNVVPLGAISFGPNWQPGFNLSTLAAQITAALSGADQTKVHFVTISGNGCTLLVAWDLKNARPQGIWEIEGEGNPFNVQTPISYVNPSANNHTEDILFAGSAAISRSVVLNLNPSGSTVGDRIVINADFPAVAGMVINFYSLSTSNVALAQFTTDGSTLSGVFEFVFNTGLAWEYLEAKAPS